MTDLSREEIKRQLQQMDPYEFEKLVAELWKLQGYETTVRQGSGDRGIDVEATKSAPFDEKVLIQAKRYTDDNKVGSEEARKYATLYQQVPDVDNVVIVTTNRFTREAESLARDLKVKIVDANALVDLIKENYTEVTNFELRSDWRDTLEEIQPLKIDDSWEPPEREGALLGNLYYCENNNKIAGTLYNSIYNAFNKGKYLYINWKENEEEYKLQLGFNSEEDTLSDSIEVEIYLYKQRKWVDGINIRKYDVEELNNSFGYSIEEIELGSDKDDVLTDPYTAIKAKRTVSRSEYNPEIEFEAILFLIEDHSENLLTDVTTSELKDEEPINPNIDAESEPSSENVPEASTARDEDREDFSVDSLEDDGLGAMFPNDENSTEKEDFDETENENKDEEDSGGFLSRFF